MFVIVDEQPFRVVESENFCRKIQPLFVIPSRFTIARDCFQLYMDEKVRVALTTDCWRSIRNLSYLTLVTHFTNND